MSHFASEKNYWKARAQHYEALYRGKSEQLIRFVNRAETAPAAAQEEEHDPWVYVPCGRHNDHSTGCSDCQRVRQSEYILKRQREVAKAICNRPDVTRPDYQEHRHALAEAFATDYIMARNLDVPLGKGIFEAAKAGYLAALTNTTK